MTKADFTLNSADKGPDGAVSEATLRLSGDWRVVSMAGLALRLFKAIRKYKHLKLDTQSISHMDTAGAHLIGHAIKGRVSEEPFLDQPHFRNLYDLVRNVTEPVEAQHQHIETENKKVFGPVLRLFNKIGYATVIGGREIGSVLVFLGHLVSSFLRSLINPRRFRLIALFSMMQRYGLEAIPIVGATNIFVGGVIGFLGVLQLQQFGASVFAIDMLGTAILREFGPVIAAVLFAGRSASSFAAELGSMKMNQEIDAMRVLNIDPFEALVLPRVLAMVIMVPLVSFVGAMVGLLGGMLVIWFALGYSPEFFIQRIYDNVPFVDYFVGLVKTPFFAATIAIIGCHCGLNVKDDVISLGRQVTKAVVQAIFALFLINALFAVMFRGVTL